MRNLKLFACMVIGSLFTIQLSLAQEKVKAVWSLSKNQEAVTEGNIKASNQNLSDLKVVGYISTASQRLLPSDSNWPKERNQNPARYIEYTVSAESGDLKITAISMDLSFNSSAAGKATVSYSTDGKEFKALKEGIELVSGSTPNEYKLDDLNIDVAKGNTFYLRIYPWTTAVIPSKYLVSRNVIIEGTL